MGLISEVKLISHHAILIMPISGTEYQNPNQRLIHFWDSNLNMRKFDFGGFM